MNQIISRADALSFLEYWESGNWEMQERYLAESLTLSSSPVTHQHFL